MLNVVWIKSFYRMLMTYPPLVIREVLLLTCFLNNIITYDIIVLMFT